MSEQSKKNSFNEVIKGIFVYLIVSIFLIFIFALILTNANMNKNTIFWINQFIKVVCIFSACFLSIRGEKGLIKGGILGLFGAIFLYVIFLVFGIASFSLPNLLCEIAFSFLLGAIFGVLTINFKK